MYIINTLSLEHAYYFLSDTFTFSPLIKHNLPLVMNAYSFLGKAFEKYYMGPSSGP